VSDKYVLNDRHEAIPCDDLEIWARMFGDAEARRVGADDVGPYRISTVFLGLDHNFGEGPPLLFETMVFSPGDDDGDMERCSTWAEAEVMHARFVERYRSKAS